MSHIGYLAPGDPDWGWEFRCEDFVFARIDEETSSADGLPDTALDALRRIAAWHSTYVDRDGRSAARCFTCEPSYGFPCTTMRSLASIWHRHSDYLPGWAETGDYLDDVIQEGGFRRAYLARKDTA